MIITTIITGWLFDIYPSKNNNKMVFWIRLNDLENNDNNNTSRYIRIEEEWQNYFYVASDNIDKLKKLVQDDYIYSSISSYEFVKRLETITDTKKSIVMKLVTLYKNSKLTNAIEKMNGYSDFRFETLKKVSTSVVLQFIG